MSQPLDHLRDHYPKILGWFLLAAALVTLLAAPPKPDFSLANFYLFIVLCLFGGLLVAGLIGPHPETVRLRREARRTACPTDRVRGDVPPREFRYWPAVTPAKVLVTAFVLVLALSMVALGALLAWAISGPWWQRVAIGAPQWFVAVLCVWIPLRQSTMWVRLDAEGVAARGYFRTVRLRWEDTVALVVTEPRILTMFGLLSVGRVYAVYSRQDHLSFVERLPGSADLAADIARASGLEWKS